MQHRYLLLPVTLAFLSASAQYCTPSFGNGCFQWSNLTVSIGDIDWSLGSSDCATADYTSMTTTVTPGTPQEMIVTSGHWCGCAVWVDLNNDQQFSDAENLYYSYVGGDPSYEYDFTITIPEGTLPGNHRMRVIGPWGSDGFLSTNTNGYGPCGDFQYGNYDDFTLVVEGSNAVAEQQPLTGLVASPSPTAGPFTLTSPDGSTIDRVIITAMDGRRVQDLRVGAVARVALDLSGEPAGIYIVSCLSGNEVRTLRITRQ